VELARAAYEEALARARADSTPSSWRRVLTAARNLRTASQEAAEGRGGRKGRRRVDASPRCGTLISISRPDASRTPAADPWRFDSRPPTAWGCWRLDRTPELAAEWERSKALMERSRRLVEESRAIWLAISRLKVQSERDVDRAAMLLR
jgi:hypothetical protein